MTDRRQEPYAYTVAQAAAMLQCSEDTIRSLIRRADIKALHLGRAVRIPRPQLERLCGIEPGGNPARPVMVH